MEDMKFQFSIGRAEESRKQHFFSNSQKSQLLGIQDFVGLGRGLLLLLLLKVRNGVHCAHHPSAASVCQKTTEEA